MLRSRVAEEGVPLNGIGPNRGVAWEELLTPAYHGATARLGMNGWVQRRSKHGLSLSHAVARCCGSRRVGARLLGDDFTFEQTAHGSGTGTERATLIMTVRQLGSTPVVARRD